MKIWIEQSTVLVCKPMSASEKPTYAVSDFLLDGFGFDEGYDFY